jgi:hypothetical protein
MWIKESLGLEWIDSHKIIDVIGRAPETSPTSSTSEAELEKDFHSRRAVAVKSVRITRRVP